MARNHQGRFASRRAGSPLGLYKDCIECGYRFYRRQSWRYWVMAQFCSSACFGANKIGRAWNEARASKHPNGCHEWPGHIDQDGYGSAKIDGRRQRVHRVAWERRKGPVPQGLYVLHRCDNPPCANEEHLFLGTAKDNYEDARAKGRHAHGERNGNATLSNELMRRLVVGDLSTMPPKAAAGIFGCPWTAIARAREGRTWNGVTGLPAPSST